MNIQALRAIIDVNGDGKISSKREQEIANSYGIAANIGETIGTVLSRAEANKSSLRKNLDKIDKTQTVDNKTNINPEQNNRTNENKPHKVTGTEQTANNGLMHIDAEDLRRKRFFAIG